MIVRRTEQFHLTADADNRFSGGERTVHLGRASSVGVTVDLVNGAWVGIPVKRIIGGGHPGAFRPAVSLVTGTRQLALASADLVGVSALYLAFGAYTAASKHLSLVTVNIEEETL